MWPESNLWPAPVLHQSLPRCWVLCRLIVYRTVTVTDRLRHTHELRPPSTRPIPTHHSLAPLWLATRNETGWIFVLRPCTTRVIIIIIWWIWEPQVTWPWKLIQITPCTMHILPLDQWCITRTLDTTLTGTIHKACPIWLPRHRQCCQRNNE